MDRVGGPSGGDNGGGDPEAPRDAGRATSTRDGECPPKRRRTALAVGLCVAIFVGAVAVSIGVVMWRSTTSERGAVGPTSDAGEEAAVDTDTHIDAETPNAKEHGAVDGLFEGESHTDAGNEGHSFEAPTVPKIPVTPNPTPLPTGEPTIIPPSSGKPTTSNPTASATISRVITIAPTTPNPTVSPTGKPTLEPSAKLTDPPAVFGGGAIVDTFTVLEQVAHDPTSFTQGLSYGNDGTIFETTGLHGQSKVRRINPTTFEVEMSIDIEQQYFGEGCAFYTDANGNGRLIHITWREQTGFVYDAATLQRLLTFSYTTTAPSHQGWGITYDEANEEFIVSDGTHFLYFWDRDTRAEKRKVAVTRFDGQEQAKLNELEFMDGLVCCNIWHSDDIICVDPVTGKSVREYDMSSLRLLDDRGHFEHVQNGIALGRDHVLLTGKRWDRMYKVVFPDWPTLLVSNR